MTGPDICPACSAVTGRHCSSPACPWASCRGDFATCGGYGSIRHWFSKLWGPKDREGRPMGESRPLAGA